MNILKHTIHPFSNIIRQRPILAIFEICLRCNSQCGYCDLPLNLGRYELTREEIKEIFTDLYKDGLRFVFLQGGEPTLRKDLLDIMQDLDAIGFSQTLITNGTRLSHEFINELSLLPVNVSVSLDTLNRERYKQIRGADQLDRVLACLERLNDYPHPKYITCVMSDINRKDVIDVLKFSEQHGFIPVVGAYHWDVERYGKVDTLLQYQKTAAVNVFKEVLQSGLIPRGYFRNYIKDNIEWLSDGQLPACDAGRYSIAIDSSGNVAPCLALPHGGNLLESTLDDILKSFDRDSIKSCSDKSSCNMLCSRVIGSNLRNPIAGLATQRYIASLPGK